LHLELTLRLLLTETLRERSFFNTSTPLGVDFLLGKNKFWMYDETPGFSGKILNVLTINAISENQAN